MAGEPYSFEDGEIVERRSVTVYYDIRRFLVDGKIKYDWVDAQGHDSDDLFDSAGEADRDAREEIGRQ